MVDFRVQPGVVSVVLFALFDLVALPLLESFLKVLVNIFYYRGMLQGHPIVIKDGNIPGVSHCLVDKRTRPVNLWATATKLALLAVIFVVESQITSTTEFFPTSAVRMSSFYLDPSDETWLLEVIRTVRRRLGNSRECVVQDGDELTYYQIGFHLMHGVELEDDFGEKDVNWTGQYDVNDSTIICLSDKNVKKPFPLARVVGCSRVNLQGCGDQSSPVLRSADIPEVSDGDERYGLYDEFNFTEYDPVLLAQIFPEFPTFRFTCLRGIVGNNAAALQRYQNCLLVVRNGTHTTVELWSYRKLPSGSFIFVLFQSGPVFEGDIAFERYQSAELLSGLLVDEIGHVSWKELSGQLVAQSSEFDGNIQVELGRKGTVTSIPLWAILVGGCSVACVLIARAVIAVLRRHDRRPKLNTIKGLGSLLREEHSPSGHSLVQGKGARIGISRFDESREGMSLEVLPELRESFKVESHSEDK